MENSTIEKVDIRLSKEEIKMLETARSMPITFDEDCPETTPERAIRFQRVQRTRHAVGEKGGINNPGILSYNNLDLNNGILIIPAGM